MSAGVPVHADPGLREGAAARRHEGVEIDLGTGVLSRGEWAAGPLHVARGLKGRLMVGTYLLPWAVFVADQRSSIPNAFARARLVRVGRFSLAAETALFHVRLDDVGREGLMARARLWPNRVVMGAAWTPRLATNVEVAGVLASASGGQPGRQEVVFHGVALASSFHAGVIQRLRVSSWLTLWARFRLLLDHAPVLLDARVPLTDTTRLRVRARANSAELASVWSTTAGVFLTRGSLNARLGVGYGHWILPWIYLPVGRRVVSADLNLYWRF